ncbi:MAG: two-component system, cell cycle response regulator [Acidimicrobiaceae bacterium]|jgi:diguanylate cyclase (GGDEF)-like protein
MTAERPLVLIGEDSLVVREVLRWHLDAHGFEIVETADGEEAVRLATLRPPSVILLGLELGGIGGFEALARLKADPALASIPVLFITGHTDTSDLVEGLHLGAHDYLRKPFEPAEVIARVRAAARLKKLQDELLERNAELYRISRADPLTGLANRRHLDEQLVVQATAARRHGYPLSVVLIDVDQFKAINDTYGHSSGDDVLCEIAHRLNATARGEDIVGRWGGEEFVVIVPHCDAEASYAVGERFREAVSNGPIETRDDDVIPVTVSVGCSGGHDELLIERADVALYAAKERGRNRTVVLPLNADQPTFGARSALSAVSPST